MFINFDEFDTVYGPIVIPAGSRFVRGSSKDHPALGSYPMYFTHKIGVARGYADQYRENGVVLTYETTKELRLYDLRFMLMVYKDLVSRRTAPLDDDQLARFKRATYHFSVSYGTCTLEQQLRLYKSYVFKDLFAKGDVPKGFTELAKHYNESLKNYGRPGFDVIEQPGVRIGETENDRMSVYVLKEVFGLDVDGYIAPKMATPYHVNGYISAEVVLFDPMDAEVRTVEPGVKTRVNVRDFILASKSITYPVLEESVGAYAMGGGDDQEELVHAREQAVTYDPSAGFLSKGYEGTNDMKLLACAIRQVTTPVYNTPLSCVDAEDIDMGRTPISMEGGGRTNVLTCAAALGIVALGSIMQR